MNKSIGEKQAEAEKEKSASETQTQTKQTEMEKKIIVITEDMETQKKINAEKIEEVNKKIESFQVDAQKKEGEGKKVGESSLNKVKGDLEKEIQNLSARVEELQAHDKGEENEEALASIRKSVNKL